MDRRWRGPLLALASAALMLGLVFAANPGWYGPLISVLGGLLAIAMTAVSVRLYRNG